MRSRARVSTIVICCFVVGLGVLAIGATGASGSKTGTFFGKPTRIGATETNGQLKAVSCPSATTCFAVGLDGNSQAVVSQGTLTGAGWTWTSLNEFSRVFRIDIPLFSIVCPTDKSCVAVGYDGLNQAIVANALVLQGKWYWSVLDVVPPDASKKDFLKSVSCSTATTCVAVGNNARNQGIVTTGHNAGGTWTWSRIEDLRSDGSGAGHLTSISCGGSATCVAVGYDGAGQSIQTIGTELRGSWTWSPSTVVAPDNSGSGQLDGVDCASAVSCVAVGVDGSYLPIETAGVKAGGSWTWSPSASVTPDGSGTGSFKSVSCFSPTSCIAVGYDSDTQAIYSAGTESGATWTWAPLNEIAPDAEGYGFLNGIACVSDSSCVTVGLDGNNHSIYASGHANNGSWSWSSSHAMASATHNGSSLKAVSCFDTTSCMAVGVDSANNPIFTAGSESHAKWTWTPSAFVPPDTSVSGYLGAGDLTGVSCPSATACIAVGTDSSLQAFYSVATRANDVWSWSAAGKVTPDARDQQGYLNDVSCPTATMCVAVGRDTSVHPIFTVGTEANGAWSWTPSTDIASDSSGHGRLDGITCPSATNCIAVGFDGQAREIATTGTDADGTWSWSTSFIVSSDGTGGGYLSAISCPSATTCVGVGFDAKRAPIVAVATQQGQSWTWQRSVRIAFDDSTHGYLNGVSCPSATSCIAVGFDGHNRAIYVNGTQLAHAWKWTGSIRVPSDQTGHGFFDSVSCPGATTCVAVGNDGDYQAIADSN
jgi:hypothetical protein